MPTLTSRATYQNVAADLRSRIETGEYRPGDRLPNDGVLADRYGIAHATLRSAVELLKTEGIIQSLHGVGRFVAIPPIIRELTRAELDRVLGDLDASPWPERPSTTHIRFAAADNASARLFGIAVCTELTVREMVIREDGVPMMLAVSTLPRTLTSGTRLEQPDPGDGIAARLRALGQPLAYKETIHARIPTEWERTRLDLADYRPLLVINRVTYTSASPIRVLESREIALRADRFQLLDRDSA